MAFKPWTEITNWAKQHNCSTEDVTRYFWYDCARTIIEDGEDDLFRSMCQTDGKLGIPRSMVPHYVNQVYAEEPVNQYLNESFTKDFFAFIERWRSQEQKI
jgi:hypothetical protein